jgi:transcriptional regulator with XRE-family HTH domain
MLASSIVAAKKQAKRQGFIPTDDDRRLAERIRAQREAMGLTQEQLAKRTGLHVVSLNRYEMVRRSPRGQDLLKLEHILGSLRDGTQTAEITGMSGPRSIDASNSDLEAFLARNADDITEREKRFLRGLRFKGRPTDETWAALLEAFRAGRAARESGGSGG